MSNEENKISDESKPTLVLEREVAEAYQRMTLALGETGKLMGQFGESLAACGRAFGDFLTAYQEAYDQPLTVAAASPLSEEKGA